MFDKYNGPMYAIAYKYCNGAENAKEIVQESWIDVFKSLHNYHHQDKLFGWMKTIVIRTAWRKMKSSPTEVELTSAIRGSVDGQHELMEKMTCDEVLSLLDQIPLKSRMVFKLFVMEEYRHKEIAKHLNITESTSRAHLTKARKILKDKYFILNKISQ